MKRISGKTGHRSGALASSVPLRRALLTLFCLFAFSFQSYISQTHIHRPGTADFGIGISLSGKSSVSVDAKASAAKSEKSQQSPLNDDVSNCPLCQAVLHAGLFLNPALLVLLLPDTQSAVGPALIVSSHHRAAPSYAWQSRGPPQH
ncbi:MAG: DUF2946 family protein [Rhizomicrobium sp.]